MDINELSKEEISFVAGGVGQRSVVFAKMFVPIAVSLVYSYYI